MISTDDLVALLDQHAPWKCCALVPELSAWHTDDEVALWRALEARCASTVGVPYFAIAWPAAQVMARALLDGRIDVRGRHVADVGCGSGLVACAAMKVGARSAMAIDVDSLAACAAAALAERHGVAVATRVLDPLAAPEQLDAEVVLCADLVSREAQRAPFASAVASWRQRGADVVLADSGRPFFDAQGLPLAFEERVAVTSRVDGEGSRTVRVFRAATIEGEARVRGMTSSHLRPGHPDFLDLPWHQPLAVWDKRCERLEELPAGLSRHTVRFVNYGGALYALKELGPGDAAKEYALLREMTERRVPTVAPIGHIDVENAERSASVLVTRYLDHSLPYHSLFLHSDLQRYRAHLVDALASLLVQLHLSGVYWGDCSLFNTLFLRDGGALQAFLVDAETSVIYQRIEDVTREHDLFILEENVAGALADLAAMTGRPSPSADALSQDVRARYRELWELASRPEVFRRDERYRIEERVRQLNRAGFSVGEITIEPVDAGELLRLRVLVTDRTFHKDLLHSLTGLDVLEVQAQQMMNEVQQMRAALAAGRSRSVSLSATAHAWLTERYQPAIASFVAADLIDDPAELYCRLLEHKWLVSEAARHDVGHEVALADLLSRVAPGH